MVIRGTHLTPGSVLAGRYRVVALLGEGAMGEVFVVEHMMTRHHRALKRLRPEVLAEHPTLAKRFLNEASAAGQIGNPHIVETVDAGTLEDGTPYLVMELLQGQGLDTRLAARTRLAVTEATEVIAQAASGMHAAHEKGIVHRDLKPANLFAVDAGVPFIKILDFGVSRFGNDEATELRMTKPGEVVGTPFYLAPEQARGDADIDRRVDIYALGVVLYECLTGRLPYEAQSQYELFTKIITGTHVPILEYRSELPPCVVDVVARAMATDRNARFTTAAEFEVALRSLPLEGIHTTDPYLGPFPSFAAPPKASPVAAASMAEAATLNGLPPPAALAIVRSSPSRGMLTTNGPLTQSQPTARAFKFALLTSKPATWIGLTALLLVLGGVTMAWLSRPRHERSVYSTGYAPEPLEQSTAAPAATRAVVVAPTQTNAFPSKSADSENAQVAPAVPEAHPARSVPKLAVSSSTSSMPVAPLPSVPPHASAPAASAAHPTASAPQHPKTLAEKAGLNQDNPFAK